jgi:membrane protein implicated in regulation of membrane protease activity
MNGMPEHGGKEPGLAAGFGLIFLMVLCCAGVPLLLTAGGAGLLAGLLTDTWWTILGGLALAVQGAVLLWWRWKKQKKQGKTGEAVASDSPWRSRAGPPG